MPETAHSYRELEEHTDRFFDDIINRLLPELRKEFSQSLLDLLIEIINEVQRIKKDDQDRYKKLIKILKNKIPEFDRWNSGEYRLEITNYWHKHISKDIANLPDKIKIRQAKERFIRSDDDSYYVRFQKGIKRRFYKISETAFRIKNRFLKLLGYNPSDDYYWAQTVPFRNVVQFHLLNDSDWLTKFVASEYYCISQTLDLLIEKEGSENKEKEEIKEGEETNEQKQNPTFRLTVLLQLDSHLETAIKFLKEYLADENAESENINEIKTAVLHTAERAGTSEVSNKKFKKSRLDKGISQSISRAELIEKKWRRYLQSQITDLKIQIELGHFGAESSSTQEKLLEKTHVFFRDLFYLPIENSISVCKDIIRIIGSENESSKKSLKVIEKAREQLSKELYDTSLTLMKDTARKEKMITDIRQLVSDLQLELNGFSESFTVAEKRDPIIPDPDLVLDNFSWKSIATRFLKDEAISSLDPDKQEFSVFIDEQLEELEEAAEIVDVNLLASLESKNEEDEVSPIDIAVSGLKRAINVLEKSIKSVREKQNGYEHIIKNSLPGSLQKLADVMLKRQYGEFEFKDKARQVKTRALNWKDKITKQYAAAEEKAELIWRFLNKKFHDIKRPLFRFLGFQQESKVSTSQKQDLTEYLIKSDAETKDLPFIYKRLFSPSFSIDKRFFIPPAGSLNVMRSEYDQWKKGIDSSVAVVGEKGSGKTLLFHFFEQDLDSEIEVVKIQFESTFCKTADLLSRFCESFGYPELSSVDELTTKMNESSKRKVILLEGLQNAYIRDIHGFEAISSFWVILSQTSHSCFWVVSCSRFAWEFFIKISNADQYFSQVVQSDVLKPEQIREGIVERHKATGYELEFIAPDSLKNSRSFKKLIGDEEKTQNYISNQYFEQLGKISDGNISIAMIFWIKSIKEYNEQRFVIEPIEVADIDLLEVPSRDVLFTLASLLRHDILNAEELAMSLHQKLSDSKLMTARLKAKGLIKETEHGFMVNHLVYRQTVRLLKSKNVLH
ncbi:MAG: ATP-binding protein [Balneolaceae bacterium]